MTNADLTPDKVSLISDPQALFVVNHSGGKDSQAMYILLRSLIPADQLIIIHADLPEVDWVGIEDHIKVYSHHPFYVVRANKTFFQMVEHRQKFPSPKNRQCTSDLKRGPINKFIRHYSLLNGYKIIVNCTGIRAEESPARAKKIPFSKNEKLSNSKRTWYEWMPIHSLVTIEVFEIIAAAGEVPFWTYAAGMSRLSCCFCFMASINDLRVAAQLLPILYKRYCDTEIKYNFTLSMSGKFLPQLIKDK